LAKFRSLKLLSSLTLLFILIFSFVSVYAAGDSSILSLKPYAKFLSFYEGEKPREIEEIEGTWALKNIDEIKLLPKFDDDELGLKKRRWERRLASLKKNINSVHVRCIKSTWKCYESIASINTDDIENSILPPRLEALLNIWTVKSYHTNQIIATYYDCCHNYTITIDIKTETVLKTGIATEYSPCHRGFTNKTLVYELGGK